MQEDYLVFNSNKKCSRIDNGKGYIVGNVIVVSFRANTIKSNATVEELERVAFFYRGLA